MILSRNIPTRKTDGKKIKQVWRIIWLLVKASTMRCKKLLKSLRLRVAMRLRNFNSSFQTWRNLADRKRKILKPKSRIRMKKLRTWKICLKRKWLSSNRKLNSKRFRTSNLRPSLTNLVRVTIKWSKLLSQRLRNLLMAENQLSNKLRISRNFINKKWMSS